VPAVRSTLPNWLTIEGVRRNLSNRRHCVECSPFGRHNTRQLAEPGSGGRPWQELRSRQDRYAALLHYSGGDVKCACCGERTLEFLALDHVNDDGAEHRRVLLGEGVHGGTGFYARLRLGGYTYARLVVMCHNCNMARGFYGRCPHQAV
jgi:hypothetical protein